MFLVRAVSFLLFLVAELVLLSRFLILDLSLKEVASINYRKGIVSFISCNRSFISNMFSSCYSNCMLCCLCRISY